MNTLLASILDCISPVAKSASLVTVAVTRSVATTKYPSFSSFPTPPRKRHFSAHSFMPPSSSPPRYRFSRPRIARFGDHFGIRFIAPETKRFEIYSLFFLDLVYDLCVIDSRQCCLSRVRNRSLRQSLSSRFKFVLFGVGQSPPCRLE